MEKVSPSPRHGHCGKFHSRTALWLGTSAHSGVSTSNTRRLALGNVTSLRLRKAKVGVFDADKEEAEENDEEGADVLLGGVIEDNDMDESGEVEAEVDGRR